ncbi:foldase PrsA [Enterococcus sp. DIV0170]
MKEASFKLKEGEVSDIIQSIETSTYKPRFYLVKMEKKQVKGNDRSKYKKEVQEIAKKNKLEDQNFQKDVTKKVLKEDDVLIKDVLSENILND